MESGCRETTVRSGVSKLLEMPLGVRNKPKNNARYWKNHPGLAKLPPGPRMTNFLKDADSMSIGVKRLALEVVVLLKLIFWPLRRQLIQIKYSFSF